jgi:hypothetical protein
VSIEEKGGETGAVLQGLPIAPILLTCLSDRTHNIIWAIYEAYMMAKKKLAKIKCKKRNRVAKLKLSWRCSATVATTIIVNTTTQELAQRLPSRIVQSINCIAIQFGDMVWHGVRHPPSISIVRRFIYLSLLPTDFEDVGHSLLACSNASARVLSSRQAQRSAIIFTRKKRARVSSYLSSREVTRTAIAWGRIVASSHSIFINLYVSEAVINMLQGM